MNAGLPPAIRHQKSYVHRFYCAGKNLLVSRLWPPPRSNRLECRSLQTGLFHELAQRHRCEFGQNLRYPPACRGSGSQCKRHSDRRGFLFDLLPAIWLVADVRGGLDRDVVPA